MRRGTWRIAGLVVGLVGLGLGAVWPDGLRVPGLDRGIDSRLFVWGGLLCLVVAVWGRAT
jgi:hypothetical protein